MEAGRLLMAQSRCAAVPSTLSLHTTTMTTTTASTSPSPVLEIGDTCQVQWRDGSQQLLAKIVETRQRKRKDSGEETEYYVHYVDHDRRLDEWIDESRFLMDTFVKAPPPVEQEEEEDGARTTRQKRRTTTTTLTIDTSTTAAARSSPSWSRQSSRRSHLTRSRTRTRRNDQGQEYIQNLHGRLGSGSMVLFALSQKTMPVDTLYVCEYCLKYMRYAHTYQRHRCECTHLSDTAGHVKFIVTTLSASGKCDGKEARVYCQNLCLLAKLFLDHKTLYYDVDPFLFYIICHVDEFGAHIVGYFSKEKVERLQSGLHFNLSTISKEWLWQIHHFAQSYELTKREGKTGSPEKPLSDLGKMAYRSYWTHMSLTLTERSQAHLTIQKMSQQTGINVQDILSTLQSLDMIKCWKGQHVVHVKQEVLEQYMKQKYVLVCDMWMCCVCQCCWSGISLSLSFCSKQFRLCKSEYLKWEPPAQRTKE